MATKPKTRTAPAAKPATHEPYDHTTTNVHNLIARWHWLEADCRYHAALCSPGGKSAVLNVRHREERDEIMQRLAETVPDRFDDTMELLDFATKRLKALKALGRNEAEETVIAMLQNARTAIYKAHIKMKMDFALRSFDEWNQFREDAA